MFEKIAELIGLKKPPEGLFNVEVVVLIQGDTLAGTIKHYTMPKAHLIGFEETMLDAEKRFAQSHK